jgi:nitroreductase
MNVWDAITQRRTVQKYRKSEIPRDTLHRALEAALTAPNHKHTYPWHFVVVGQETRRELMELVLANKLSKLTNPDDEARAKVAANVEAKMMNPAALVVFVQKLCDDDFRCKEDYASVACAIQNFSIALTAEGYGSKWGSGAVTRSPKTYKLLGLDPETHEISGFVFVGHSSVAFSERRRPALSDVLRELP